jgi:hypothetical protein
MNAFDLLKNEGHDNSICALFDCKSVSGTRQTGSKVMTGHPTLFSTYFLVILFRL